MVFEEAVACVNQCVVGQSPLLAGVNSALMAAMAISLVALVLFGRRLSLKASFFLKSLFLSSFFVFILALSVSNIHMAYAILPAFHIWHNVALLFVVALFGVSFFLAPFIMQFQLRREGRPEVDRIVSEEAAKLNLKSPNVMVYRDYERKAFVVSGLSKKVFLSTALVDSLPEDELRLVVVHELMHLKSNFFNIKRFLDSVRSSFFGLLPIHLEELDLLEELRIERKMLNRGLSLSPVREKL